VSKVLIEIGFSREQERKYPAVQAQRKEN